MEEDLNGRYVFGEPGVSGLLKAMVRLCLNARRRNDIPLSKRVEKLRARPLAVRSSQHVGYRYRPIASTIVACRFYLSIS